MSTRIELPFSGNTVCEIRVENRKTTLTFFKNNKQIGQKSFMGELSEDLLVDALATTGVEFVTFSAVYDASNLILKTLSDMDVQSTDEQKIFETSQVNAAIDESQGTTDSYHLTCNIDPTNIGDLVLNWEIPYSYNTWMMVFRKKRQFYVVFAKKNEELFRTEIIGNLNEKKAYKLIDEAKLQFVSLSVSAQVVEKLLDIIQFPQKYDVIANEAQLKRGVTSKLKSTGGKPKQFLKEQVSKTSQPPQEDKPKPVSIIGIPDDAGILLDDYEMPYSGKSHVHTYYNKKIPQFTVVFFKDDGITNIAKIGEKPQAEEVTEAISSSKIDFVSMSTIFTITDHIMEIISNPNERLMKLEGKTDIEEISASSKVEVSKSDKVKDLDETLSETNKEIDIGNFITEIQIPYSHNTSCKAFHNIKTGMFALSFWRDGQEIDQYILEKSSSEDDIGEKLSNSKVEFISMSVIYDIASELSNIFSDPDKYVQKQLEQLEKKSKSLQENVSDTNYVPEIKEEEIPVDYSLYRKPEDIDSLIEVLKKSLGTDRPIMVREGNVEKLKDIGYRIYRQGENIWSMEFFNKKDKTILTQRPMKLKQVNFDEVFRVVNNGIPQITLSAVNDASEGVYNDLKLVAERPADDLIFNQIVNHFEKIIDEYESTSDLKGAIALTNGLMKKLDSLNNASGVAKFGTRLAKLYEMQDKFPESAKLRQEIFPKLLESGDFQAAKEFLDNSLDLFTNNLNRYLDAAQMAVEFGDTILKKKKDLLLSVQYIKNASDYYKSGSLPVAQAEHNLKYGKLYLQILYGEEPLNLFEPEGQEKPDSENNKDDGKINGVPKFDSFSFNDDPFKEIVEDENLDEISTKEIEQTNKTEYKISTKKKEKPKSKADQSKDESLFPGASRFDLRSESINNIINSVLELFDEAISVYETRKDRFEVLENITEIILIFRNYKLLEQETFFAKKGVIYLSDYGQPDRAMKLGLQMIEKLFSRAGFVTPALEFFNQVIKLYYAENNLISALQLSLTTVQKLIKLKENETAQQYLTFTAELIQRIYPKMSNDSIDYYLKLAQSYQDLNLAQESMVYLTQVLTFKKKDQKELIQFCLDTERRFLKELNLKFAQDFINTAIQGLGNKNLDIVFQIAEGFSIDLLNERQAQLSMQYLTYAYQISQSMSDPLNKAGGLVVGALDRFLETQNVETAIPYIESLLPIIQAYYQKTQDWEQAVSVYSKLVSALLLTRKTELKVKYTKDLATFYYWNKDHEKAAEALIRTRDKILVESVTNARELTDIAVKVITEIGDKGIKLAATYLNPLIKQLIQDKQFSDAYVYTIKSAKFYETTNDIEGCTKFLTEIRELLEKYEQYEDAERITNLMLRLNRNAGNTTISSKISVEYFQKLVDLKYWEQSYYYLTSAADIAAKKKNYDETDRLLDWGYDIYIEQPDAQNEAEDLINEIIKFRQAVRKLKKKDELELLRQSALRALDFNSIELSNRLMSKVVLGTKETNPSALHNTLTVHLEKLFSLDLLEPSLPYLSDLLNIHVNNTNYLKDLLFYYIENYLKSNRPDLATKIVDTVLERLKSDLGTLISITMRFIQLLVEYRFIETAKKYLDQALENIFPQGPSSQGEQLAYASINQKFANMIFEKAPEIAIEYSVKAADMFKRIHDYDKMIETYLGVAKRSKETDTRLRILKRAQFQCDQVKIDTKKQLPILKLLILAQIESNSPGIQKDFQDILSKLEEKQDLKETLSFLEEAFSRMIRSSQFDFFYNYIDYVMTIISGYNKSQHLKFFVRIAAQYYHQKGDKTRVTKLRDCFNQIKEPEPTQDQLDHYWKYGEFVAPKPKEVPKVVEVSSKPSIKEPIKEEEVLPVIEPVSESIHQKTTIDVEEEEDIDFDSIKEISNTLSAAINALNELKAKPTEVNIENAPEITSESIQDFKSSLVMPEETEALESTKNKQLSNRWGVKSHKELHEEMGDVVDELANKLASRQKSEAKKVSILGPDEPAEKLWEDAQTGESDVSVETLDTSPAKSNLKASDFGDLFKNALSNLQSLISTVSDEEDNESKVTSTTQIPGTDTSQSEVIEDEVDEEDEFESLLTEKTDVIAALREDLLKNEFRKDLKKFKEEKTKDKKNKKFDLTPPPTSRAAIPKGSGQLTQREENIYIELTIAYRKLVEENEVYIANQKWQEVLPELLKKHSISAQDFEDISQIGDKDYMLQDYIEKEMKKEK
ncbi:MAG: tetratricopeptide repeat protein [Candidatus Thorarchaeota archaeon]